MQKKTILIVDDQIENLDILEVILESQYNTAVADSGEEALSIIEKSLPNLILLDIDMPRIDGYELLRRLKNDPKTIAIPVIFVTGRISLEDEMQGFRLGAVDYINKPVSPARVLARVKTHLNLVQMDSLNHLAKAAIEMLAEAGHYNDSDTGSHIWRMASYSKIIALAAGWDLDSANELELAATMHDTGKIGIDNAILTAPRQLTTDEWEVMKTHTEIGYQILSKSNHPLFLLSATIARYHHEKYDGTGYPFGLKADEIPQVARIVAIADVFDALTMKRSYKEPWSIEDTIAEIQKLSGTHLDPQLVDLFMASIDKILALREELNYPRK